MGLLAFRNRIAVIIRIAMLPDDPARNQVPYQQLVEVAIRGLFTNEALSDLFPDACTGYPIAVVDCVDDFKMKFGVAPDPVQKKPDDIVACRVRRRRVCQDVSDDIPFPPALRSRPIPKRLPYKRLIRLAVQPLQNFFILEIEPRHDIYEGLLFFCEFIRHHSFPMLNKTVNFFPVFFGPGTGGGRERIASRRNGALRARQRSGASVCNNLFYFRHNYPLWKGRSVELEMGRMGVRKAIGTKYGNMHRFFTLKIYFAPLIFHIVA
ncbi:MAG: hypothetical protein A4E73_01875 [Syntrophaceae bacterium PtaU1.Bin231]|nr:MAG: hypothetical protein A4E73_01875 [Syntrophaceae bacterium PtaU1.Bin231]